MTDADTTKPLVCPVCGYDVSQTLADGINACPECGGAIDESVCREAGEAQGGGRAIVWYLGLCCAAPLATVMIATALSPIGFGRLSPAITVVGAMAAYAGGTVCLLGWPTGAGFVVERTVRRGRAVAGFALFVTMLVIGGVLMVGSAMLGMMLAGSLI